MCRQCSACQSSSSSLSLASSRAQLSVSYQKAYDRVVETLLSAGCEFREGVAVKGGENGRKVVPRDRDICLSVFDTLTNETTKTKVLNSLSNRVARTMLYGDETDVAKLLEELEAGRQAFLDQWVGPLAAAEGNCDEALYYGSLIAHLRGGLDLDPSCVPSPMRGGYGNAYQRLVTLLVQELGTRSTPVNGELFDSFVRWESSLRKNLTSQAWEAHPKELTGHWHLYDGSRGRTFKVGFRRDGSLRLPAELGVEGTWRLEPGPTHLDTVHFDVKAGTPDGRLFSYTGYVDRGQRIETRFSKRPIKVMGRMIMMIRGEPRTSSKFMMELARRDQRHVKLPVSLGGEAASAVMSER